MHWLIWNYENYVRHQYKNTNEIQYQFGKLIDHFIELHLKWILKGQMIPSKFKFSTIVLKNSEQSLWCRY